MKLSNVASGQPQQGSTSDPEIKSNEFLETAKSGGLPQQSCGSDPEMEKKESHEPAKSNW